MGRGELQIHSVRTTTSTIPRDHRGIDVSLGALICHGIVERTTENMGINKISRILKLN